MGRVFASARSFFTLAAAPPPGFATGRQGEGLSRRAGEIHVLSCPASPWVYVSVRCEFSWSKVSWMNFVFAPPSFIQAFYAVRPV